MRRCGGRELGGLRRTRLGLARVPSSGGRAQFATSVLGTDSKEDADRPVPGRRHRKGHERANPAPPPTGASEETGLSSAGRRVECGRLSPVTRRISAGARPAENRPFSRARQGGWSNTGPGATDFESSAIPALGWRDDMRRRGLQPVKRESAAQALQGEESSTRWGFGRHRSVRACCARFWFGLRASQRGTRLRLAPARFTLRISGSASTSTRGRCARCAGGQGRAGSSSGERAVAAGWSPNGVGASSRSFLLGREPGLSRIGLGA